MKTQDRIAEKIFVLVFLCLILCMLNHKYSVLICAFFNLSVFLSEIMAINLQHHFFENINFFENVAGAWIHCKNNEFLMSCFFSYFEPSI